VVARPTWAADSFGEIGTGTSAAPRHAIGSTMNASRAGIRVTRLRRLQRGERLKIAAICIDGNAEMAASKSHLVRQIDEAFAEARYPGDGNIAYDQSGRHIECNQVAASFRGKNWRDLSLDFVRKNADALFFFSPAAYAYFLPAFLENSLRDFDNAGVTPGNIVVSLSASLSSSTPEQFTRRIGHLTVPQRKAITAFLMYLATDKADYFPLGDPKIAIDEFWSRYVSV
jgi:hypothetical protein